MKGIKFNDIVIDFPEGGGLNIADLPKFTNKLYINMANATALAGVCTFTIVESSNFVVDWGDGTTTDYVEATTEISHTYADTSFKGWIYIYGDWKGIQFAIGSASSNPNKLIIENVIYDNNITDLPKYAFYNCNKLKYIIGLNEVVSVGYQCFQSCAFSKISLPKATTFGDYAFSNCDNLMYVDFANTPITFGKWLCFGCGFTEFTINDKQTTIKYMMFQSCEKLTKLTIGNSLTNIGYDILDGCSNMHTVILKSSVPPTASNDPFDNQVLKNIFVPYNSLKDYKVKTNWTDYADKIYPEGGNYSETLTIPSTAWDTSTNTVTVEAVGATSEDRNIITWNVSSGGVQVENTYGLKCTAQGTMSLTFSCETIPTEDVEVSVRYMLTNY